MSETFMVTKKEKRNKEKSKKVKLEGATKSKDADVVKRLYHNIPSRCKRFSKKTARQSKK